MVHKRPPLPKVHNFMLDPQNSPNYQQLVDRRRLTQTDLTTKAGHVGSSNAVKGIDVKAFDYAHLKAPLPPDLVESELFQQGHPLDAYFLMRRSHDGYVSASGMFKLAFPWAKTADEEVEKKYLKTLPTTSDDEVAGNTWVSPAYALELAEQYKMGLWIRALLDPTPILRGNLDTKKPISSPPPFILPEENILSPPSLAPNTGRGRGRRRSSSPNRAAQSTRKIASPRKRAAKTQTQSFGGAIQNAYAQTANVLPSVEDPMNDQAVAHPERVHVEVDAAVDTNGTVETEFTKVKVDVLSEVPDAAAESPDPSDTARMIATARKMVEGARTIDGIVSGRKSKRKADDLDVDDDEDIMEPPSKETKVLEQQLKTERVKTKALLGLSATLAVGAVVPYLL